MAGFEIEVAGRLMPVSRVFCIGRNYADHMAELDSAGNQSCVIFMKPLTSLLSVGEPIVAPRGLGALHHEVELVVAIGAGGRDIATEAALEHVAGYGLGLDLTLRDLQHQLREDNAPWEVCKGFDGSAPISPFVGAEALGDPTSVELACRVNGELRQAGQTSMMLTPVAGLVAQVSRHWRLLPGDLIFTGTPAGVGPLVPGDSVTIASAAIGAFTWSVM
jgi:2-keto-4-pentenoate hydratase/2-oxohepta-3-ene-1,7-dioic acid hydratase in catechol pathway